VDFGHFAFGQEPQTVYKSQLAMKIILMNAPGPNRAAACIMHLKSGEETSMAEIRDTVILGSGCAGLTAAIYTARAGLNRVLEGHEPGGQLSMTTLVRTFRLARGHPGAGADRHMKKQAERFGLVSDRAFERRGAGHAAHSIDDLGGGDSDAYADCGLGRQRAVVGLPSEQALIGHGVSVAPPATDFLPRREIAVVGGGDSAMEEALFLTRFASK